MSFVPIQSSNIKEVEYLEDLQRLNVRFQDRSIYSYNGVSKQQYEGFMAAESKGRYLRSHIVNTEDPRRSASSGLQLVPDKSSGAAVSAEKLTLFVPDDCCVPRLQRDLRTTPAITTWQCKYCCMDWKLDTSEECPVWKPEVCMEVFKI